VSAVRRAARPLGRPGALAVGVGAAVAAVHAAPALTSIGPLRRALLPALSGQGRPDHVALTFDDGPDPQSTPAFTELLHDRVRATFFLLGHMVSRATSLTRELVAAGHEVAVHGWHHAAAAPCCCTTPTAPPRPAHGGPRSPPCPGSSTTFPTRGGGWARSPTTGFNPAWVSEDDLPTA